MVEQAVQGAMAVQGAQGPMAELAVQGAMAAQGAQGPTAELADQGAMVAQAGLGAGALSELNLRTESLSRLDMGTGALSGLDLGTGAFSRLDLGIGALSRLNLGTGALSGQNWGTESLSLWDMGRGPTAISRLWSGTRAMEDCLLFLLLLLWAENAVTSGLEGAAVSGLEKGTAGRLDKGMAGGLDFRVAGGSGLRTREELWRTQGYLGLDRWSEPFVRYVGVSWCGVSWEDTACCRGDWIRRLVDPAGNTPQEWPFASSPCWRASGIPPHISPTCRKHHSLFAASVILFCHTSGE
ncbi:hypothetical protein QQF64_023266 [Cirrhinus molitorella]|uniref:Uncharacterized protein n=1 Tax=Cirrhinus molitorella TaxID=172907 RepID=A0ABR3L6I0_9TELE